MKSQIPDTIKAKGSHNRSLGRHHFIRYTNKYGVPLTKTFAGVPLDEDVRREVIRIEEAGGTLTSVNVARGSFRRQGTGERR